MPRAVSSTTREQIQSPNMTKVALVLLTIDHPSLGSPIRVVNNNESITNSEGTFIATAFDFSPPTQEEGKNNSATLTIDNVDRVIVQTIRSLDSAPTVTAKIVMADTPDVTEVGPWEFELRNVNYDLQKVSGSLTYQTYMRDLVSTIRYTSDLFPALVQ